ncbi:MAG TPA: 50S ribosomal protein L16 [archaeon]|nr:50S ribosomal protein L16 [archaeon]
MKGKNYRSITGQAYTRKEYIHASPQSRLGKFTMGDTKAKFEQRVSLVSIENVQIRHNALEAARIAANKVLFDKLGEKGYCLRIQVYPHQVFRENKMMAFAGADRLQKGMRQSFGTPTGTAARVRINQAIMFADVNANGIEVAKLALEQGSKKLPTVCRVEIKKLDLSAA